MGHKTFEKVFIGLCFLATLGIMASAGYDHWQTGDRQTASLLWIAALPIAIVMAVLAEFNRRIAETDADQQQKKQLDNTH